MGVAIPIFGQIGSSLGRHHGESPRRTERFGVKVLLAPVEEPGAEGLALLSPAEEERAQRFRSSAARAEFVAARTLLRRGLAEHTATKPEGLRLDCTELGKPYLVQDAWPAVEFSLSHTQDRIAIAIADGLAVGVDVERIRPLDDDMSAAAEFMTPEELEEFATLPACERDAGFFRVWTRKEAVLKAAGAGFTIDALETVAQFVELLRKTARLSSAIGTLFHADFADFEVREVLCSGASFRAIKRPGSALCCVPRQGRVVDARPSRKNVPGYCARCSGKSHRVDPEGAPGRA